MKTIIKIYVVSTLSLYLASIIFKGIVFEKGLESLFLAGAGLAVVSLLVKPILNLLLLPLNLITFGLFRWVSSAVALYIVTLVVTGFKILNFVFLGLTNKWFDIPSFKAEGVLAYIAFSLAISIFSSIIHWIIK